MSSEAKRSRSANFSLEEKIRLVNLIEGSYKAVQTKKLDLPSLKEKEAAWFMISKEFNEAASGLLPYRTTETLKHAWKNLKKRNPNRLDFVEKQGECYATAEKDYNSLFLRVKAISELADSSVADGDNVFPNDTEGECDEPVNTQECYQAEEVMCTLKEEDENSFPAPSSEVQSEQECSDDETQKETSRISAKELYYREKLRLVKVQMACEGLEMERKEELHKLAMNAARQREKFYELAIERMQCKLEEDRTNMERRDEMHRLELKRKKRRLF